MTRGLRAAATLAFLAVALATTVLVFRAVAAFGTPEVEVGLDVIDPIEATLSEMRSELHSGVRVPGAVAPLQIAFLGDSMVISYPEGRTIPDRLQQQLDHHPGAPRVQVRPLAQPGMGPFDFYFLADRVADAGPDLVILPFNLESFSDAWRGTFSRPHLAGFLPPTRIPRTLTLPIGWIGLTADRMLAYVSIVQAGAGAPWHALVKEQARVGRARRKLAWDLGKAIGHDANSRFARAAFRAAAQKLQDKKTHRMTAAGLRERFGPILDGVAPDDPVLEMLDALVRIFVERGIRVLVYVDPLNVEDLARSGMAGGPGLDRTLASLERVARQAGAGFADLHALLPNPAFRDGAGHLTFKPNTPDGPLRVAVALAPIVLSREGLAHETRAPAATEAGD